MWGVKGIDSATSCLHSHPISTFLGKLLTSLCLSFPISNMEPLHITRPGSVSAAYGLLFHPGSHTPLGKPTSLSFLGLTGRGIQVMPAFKEVLWAPQGQVLEMEKHLTNGSCGYCYNNVFWHRKWHQLFWNTAGHRNVYSDPVCLRWE